MFNFLVEDVRAATQGVEADGADENKDANCAGEYDVKRETMDVENRNDSDTSVDENTIDLDASDISALLSDQEYSPLD